MENLIKLKVSGEQTTTDDNTKMSNPSTIENAGNSVSERKRKNCSYFPGVSSVCNDHDNNGLDGTFLLSCQHRVCRVCLNSHAAHLIEKFASDRLENMYNFINLKILCPVCKAELCKADIIELFDHDIQTYETLLEESYSNIYAPVVHAKNLACIKCKQEEATLSQNFYHNKGKGKAKERQDIGDIESPSLWTCTACGFSWCKACGASGFHICKEDENYKLYEIVSALELIWNHLVRGPLNPDSHKETIEESINMPAHLLPQPKIDETSTTSSVLDISYHPDNKDKFELDLSYPNNKDPNSKDEFMLDSVYYPNPDKFVHAISEAMTELFDYSSMPLSENHPVHPFNYNVNNKDTLDNVVTETTNKVSHDPSTSLFNDPNNNKDTLSGPDTPLFKHSPNAQLTSFGDGSTETFLNFQSFLHPRHTETVWKSGTGFGGGLFEKTSANKAKEVEKGIDGRARSLFTSLTTVLDNITMGQSQSILTFSNYVLLCRNQIVIKLLDYYMSNDSMLDICERSELYHQLACSMTAMKNFAELLPVLTGSFENNQRNDKSLSEFSLIKKMKNINEQSNFILKRFEGEEIDSELNEGVTLAKYLSECYLGLMVAIEKKMPDVMKTVSCVDEGSSTENLSDKCSSDSEEGCSETETKINALSNSHAYKESMKPLQFKECSLVQIACSSSTFERKSKKMLIDNSGIHNKKRMMYIAKDLACLSTSLPLEWESSIHVRVDPIRTELLKAMIVGPKGTPYQNGVFIFEIHLPPDYPQLPPSVTFLTTGQGQVRFNPNLYQNGKVCLSLLGTWEGPGWQPWKSTLLQVLVSIQSLIFVAEPFYNEPGHEMINSQTAAEAENRRHRYNTLRLAILGALRDPDPNFKDVILMHFQHKKAEITEQCLEWGQLHDAAGKGQHPSGPNIKLITDQIISELVKLP